jgi:hypothetical protein
MRKRLFLLIGSLLALPATASADDRILRFDTMAAVVRPFTGSANPIRGVNGGGVPWELAQAKGELRADGRLKIDVEGLVVVSSGVNPSAAFRAIVSCLTTADGLTVTTTNVMTLPFPATPTGDSEIEAVVTLPSPCVAPIVFVTNATGTSWFAATGN